MISKEKKAILIKNGSSPYEDGKPRKTEKHNDS